MKKKKFLIFFPIKKKINTLFFSQNKVYLFNHFLLNSIFMLYEYKEFIEFNS
jgi:hypothetical protein